jgi:uncharacterized protein (TIGR02246 family)
MVMNPSSDALKDVARRSHDAWNTAFNRGDPGAVAALYTDEATVLPPTHAIIKGTAAIRDFWQGLVAAGFREHGIEMIDAGADGDMAFTTGRWWASGPGAGGGTQRFEGVVVTLLRRQDDGSWKICLHTWN